MSERSFAYVPFCSVNMGQAIQAVEYAPVAVRFRAGWLQPIALMRADRRDTLREAVFLWVTPLVTARMISG